MTIASTNSQTEDDKAKLAYALARSFPAHHGWEIIGEMFCVSKTQAQSLINKGRRLAAMDPPPIKTTVR